jgi:hypothetical protein
MCLDNYKDNLKIATWYSTGIISGAIYFCDLLIKENIDIFGISEHWLYRKDLHILDNINNIYISFSVSNPDLDMPSLRRMGKGGLAMLWPKKWNSHITSLDIVSKYFIGIQIMIKPKTYIILLQIYMPCGNHPMHVYRNCLEEQENIICMYIDKGTLIVMGDYNTELKSDRITSTIPQSPRSAPLLALLRKYNLQTINTLKSCRGAKNSNVP